MKTGHSRLWVAGLVLLLVGVGGFFLIRDDGAQIVPPRTPVSRGNVTSTRGDAAAGLLSRLQSRLAGGTRQAVLALAEPGNAAAVADIAMMFDNARDLDIRDLSLRYVDANEGQLRGRTWVADVQIAWRIAGFDRRPSRMEVPFTFVQAQGGAAFVSVRGDPDGAVPLWLLDDVAVERDTRSLVMVAGQSHVGDFSSLADQAVADVIEVLPRWRGKLVVEVPGSEEDLERVVGAQHDAYRAIAAVTSTVDGSLDPSSPAHILVNPVVFGRLGEEGAQIVMSHEATHVATAAATSTMPMWLLEGFADYVALAHADLPVSVTAGQILAQVRKNGPPKRLPGERAFDAANTRLGTSYEAAWLACRFIGERYGERALIAFYDAVDSGLPVRTGFRRVLDTDQRVFASGWRDYLRRLAS